MIKNKRVKHAIYGLGTVVRTNIGECYVKVEFDSGHSCDVPESSLDSSPMFKYDIYDELIYVHMGEHDSFVPKSLNGRTCEVICRDIYYGYERYEVEFDNGDTWFVREFDLTERKEIENMRIKVGSDVVVDGIAVGIGELIEDDKSGLPYRVKMIDALDVNDNGESYWFYEDEVKQMTKFKVGDWVRTNSCYNGCNRHVGIVTDVCGSKVTFEYLNTRNVCDKKSVTVCDKSLDKLEHEFNIGDNVIYGDWKFTVEGIYITKNPMKHEFVYVDSSGEPYPNNHCKPYVEPKFKKGDITVGKSGKIYRVVGYGEGYAKLEHYEVESISSGRYVVWRYATDMEHYVYTEGEYVKLPCDKIGKYVRDNGDGTHVINDNKLHTGVYDSLEFEPCEAPKVIPVGVKFKSKRDGRTGKVIEDSIHGFHEMYCSYDGSYRNGWEKVEDIEIIPEFVHKFKVGDKVKITGRGVDCTTVVDGKVGEITDLVNKLNGKYDYRVKCECRSYSLLHREEDLELVDEVADGVARVQKKFDAIKDIVMPMCNESADVCSVCPFKELTNGSCIFNVRNLFV